MKTFIQRYDEIVNEIHSEIKIQCPLTKKIFKCNAIWDTGSNISFII